MGRIIKPIPMKNMDIIDCTLKAVPIKKSSEASQLGFGNSDRVVKQGPSDHLDVESESFKV